MFSSIIPVSALIILIMISGIRAQCPSHETSPGGVTFVGYTLRKYASCVQVSYTDCLFVHEAISKCPCICSEKLIKGDDDQNTYKDDANNEVDDYNYQDGWGQCPQMSRCIQKIVDGLRNGPGFEAAIGAFNAQKRCPQITFDRVMNSYKELFELQLDRLHRMSECLVRLNDGDPSPDSTGFQLGAALCEMPSDEEMTAACSGSRRLRHRRQTGDRPKLMLFDDVESLGAFAPIRSCLGDNICDCPHAEYCFQCYQREQQSSTHLDIHNKQRLLTKDRLMCGLTDRQWPAF